MYKMSPKRKFGQNFLIDQSILEKIISTAGNLENKSILEIGGGSGNLTKYLLEAKPKKLLVIEIDKDYSEILSKILDNNSCLLYTSPSPRDATLSRMPSSA